MAATAAPRLAPHRLLSRAVASGSHLVELMLGDVVVNARGDKEGAGRALFCSSDPAVLSSISSSIQASST